MFVDLKECILIIVVGDILIIYGNYFIYLFRVVKYVNRGFEFDVYGRLSVCLSFCMVS